MFCSELCKKRSQRGYFGIPGIVDAKVGEMQEKLEQEVMPPIVTSDKQQEFIQNMRETLKEVEKKPVAVQPPVRKGPKVPVGTALWDSQGNYVGYMGEDGPVIE